MFKKSVDARKNILYITPGPTWRPHSIVYQSQFNGLSKSFKGYIFTTSSGTETFRMDNFTFISMKFEFSKTKVLKFYFFCFWNAVKFLVRKERIHLVVTYDPLTTGIIGFFLSCVLWTNFATEVPGVYTSAGLRNDEGHPLKTKLRKKIYPLIMRFILSRAKGIRLRFREQIDPINISVKGKVVCVLHGFVDLENFRNLKEEKEILLVGFPFKVKGVDILIEAFKKVAHKHPDWKLKIMGWYPDSKELNAAIGGHPQIYHHPPVPHDEIPKHIGSCGILALPSRSDALARVLLEGMAAGKPRVGSRVDGTPSIINDGVDGFLVEPENVDDLAEKLDMLMSDPDLRSKLGKMGEVRAKTEFSNEQYFMKLANFYTEVIDKGDGDRRE